MTHCQQEYKDACGFTKPFSAAKVAVLDSSSWHVSENSFGKHALKEADLRFKYL